MSILKIDDKNEIYYEFREPKAMVILLFLLML